MRYQKTQSAIASLIGITALPLLYAGTACAAAAFVNANPVIVGHVAQPELTNSNLLSGKENIYRGEYERGGWSGNLSCYPVSNTGLVGTTTPCWSSGTGATAKTGAQAKVDAQGFASGARNIATLDTTGKPVAFTLAADTVNLIDANHVNFIRGDRSQEAPTGTLRTRLSALGDVVHSRPYFVNDLVSPTVFYGGNDGMLHAIDATPGTGGAERWAYIPSMLVPKLNKLWASSYTHEFYVDGNIGVTNAGTTAAPQNILVGVLGAGGRGIYALDVTNLTAASDAAVASKFQWEITPTSITTKTGRIPSTSYKNLGDTFSNPTLYPVENGKSAVIVGNGYNNTGTGTATLLVIDTQTGALIREIDTGAGTPSSPNGLSTPAVVDRNSNGRADLAYAGDIDGNMWKFDMSNPNPAAWTVSKLYATSSNPATPAGQAITMMPGVATHPSGGYMVTFATGRLFTAADAKDASFHYVYGVWDGAPSANTSMINQTVQSRPYTAVAGATPVTVRVVGTTPEGATVYPNWSIGGNKGWITKLPVAGERVTGDTAFIQNGRFFFNATNPLSTFTPAGWPTNSGSGENWLMELNYSTGGGASVPFFDMNGDAALNNLDRIKYVAGDVITAPNTVGSPITTEFGVPVGLFTSNGVQSQPVVGGLGALNVVFYNQNFDGTPAPVIPPGSTGVGNGHFDVDIAFTHSSTTFGQGGTDTHNHEYDKTWDTNGLNFLNPNDKTLGLSTAGIPGMTDTTPYKVLLMNQGWNRAMTVKVGTTVWSTKDYQTGTANGSGKYLATGQLDVSTLPVYTGTLSQVTAFTTVPATSTTSVPGKVTVTAVSTKGSIGCGGMTDATATAVPIVAGSGCSTTKVNTGAREQVGGLEFAMPFDGFSVKDWWNDGKGSQVGVMPTTPQCADGMNNNGSVTGTNVGPSGERHNGVLTVQIIRAATPNADVVMNVAGKPQYGFRVIDSKITTDVLAEYTLYWHHPMALCMGDSTTTWKVVNNQKDPWWPAQATVNNPSTSNPTVMGPLKCYSSQKSGSYSTSPAWISKAPAGWTTPPGWPPVGWTITPQPDLATTLPPCPVYDSTSDDPRNASFITSTTTGASTGGGGTGTTTTTPIAVPVNLIGGTPTGAYVPPPATCGGPGQVACAPSSCGGVGQPACTPSGCGGAGQPACPKCGGVGQPACCGAPPLPACASSSKPARTGRLSWHELIDN